MKTRFVIPLLGLALAFCFVTGCSSGQTEAEKAEIQDLKIEVDEGTSDSKQSE